MGVYTKMRGCNHIPNPALMTHNYKNLLPPSAGGTFDVDVYRQEVQFLRSSLGIRLVRLFWSPYAFFAHREAFSTTINQVAAILQEIGIEVQLVLLDSVTGSTSFLANPLIEPWYDLYGANGTQAWDPLAATNPGLINGSTGILDVQAAIDTASFDSQFPNRPPGYHGGGWMGAPGMLYSAIFDIPVYPAVPAGHGALWTGLIDAMETIIEAFQSHGILHSIDVNNEPEFILPAIDWASPVTPYPPIFFEFFANVAFDAPTRLVQALLRQRALMNWCFAAAADLAPGVPRTCGHVKASDMIFAYKPYTGVEGSGLGCDVGEFITFHSYGNGRLLADEINYVKTALAELPEPIRSLDVTVNESYRQEQGDDHLLHYLHEFDKAGFGHITWDLFSSPGFGGSQSAVYPPAGAQVPAGYAWPITGIVRSHVVDGTTQILVKRPDLLPVVSRWAGGKSVDAPSTWAVRRAERLTFFIHDVVNDSPLEAQDSTHFYWRYMLLDPQDVPSNPAGSFLYVDAPGSPFSFFIAAGQWLDIDQNIAPVLGSPFFVVDDPDLIAQAVSEGKTLVVAAIFGEGPYDLLQFDNLQHHYATFFAVPASELQSLEVLSADYTRVRDTLRDVVLSTPFYRLRSGDIANEESVDWTAAVQPVTAQVDETSSAFDQSRSRRKLEIRKTPANYTLELKFRNRVLLERFEQRAGILRVPGIDGRPSLTLTITNSQVVHPPTHDAENGTSATYTYSVQANN